MAKHVIYNASVILNSVDLSDHTAEVTWTDKTNKVPGAAMGELEDYSIASTNVVGDITLNMWQDFAASKTYATLSALQRARTTFTALIKADAGANSTTNPQLSIPVFINSMDKVKGKRGDAHMTQVVLSPAGVSSILTS